MSVLTRRQALGLLGAATLARVGAGRAWAAMCDATRPATQGPFWLDDTLERSDIRTDPSDGTARPGVPLRLRLKVVRSDADCAPAAGVQVDLWQCDAGGLYSDDPGGGTVGGRFLRGYQVADGSGAVEFTTIYPGWYPGRTIHVHYRVRTFAAGTATTDFASQLYFDDAISDQVLATAPYDARGPRDRTNADDVLFDPATILGLAPDGSGGWIGTFDVALAGLPPGADTACDDLASCRAAAAAALPDASTASGRKARKVARRLARLYGRAETALDRAAGASGTRRQRQYEKVRSALARLTTVAAAADGDGTLGVPLAPLAEAVDALRALVPAVQAPRRYPR
jgi:protocatechuate 3,4-dioxygenase beta subunit